LGTWKSLYENSPKDKDGNVVTGKVLTYDTKNSIIKIPKDQLVVVQGLDNVIVAEFDGVLLICSKDEEQRVRDFVADAKNLGEKFV
jgi:mannose-1-phosphate guanylyltransferase